MKIVNYFGIGFGLLFMLMGTASPLFAQEAESKTVKFRLNNAPDREAPDHPNTCPGIAGNAGFYLTETQEVEVIGEVTDASKIRFVSVNNDIR